METTKAQKVTILSLLIIIPKNQGKTSKITLLTMLKVGLIDFSISSKSIHLNLFFETLSFS
jgi:hypothetical protein